MRFAYGSAHPGNGNSYRATGTTVPDRGHHDMKPPTEPEHGNAATDGH